MLRCGIRSGTEPVASRQAWATLRAVASLGSDLGPLAWVSSLFQTFPGQIQTILSVGSLPGCKARGWHHLGSVFERQGATHLSTRR